MRTLRPRVCSMRRRRTSGRKDWAAIARRGDRAPRASARRAAHAAGALASRGCRSGAAQRRRPGESACDAALRAAVPGADRGGRPDPAAVGGPLPARGVAAFHQDSAGRRLRRPSRAQGVQRVVPRARGAARVAAAARLGRAARDGHRPVQRLRLPLDVPRRARPPRHCWRDRAGGRRVAQPQGRLLRRAEHRAHLRLRRVARAALHAQEEQHASPASNHRRTTSRPLQLVVEAGRA